METTTKDAPSHSGKRECCRFTRRTKIIIYICVTIPVLGFIGLAAGVLINAATIKDPYQPMKFTDEEPKFMPSTEQAKLERAEHLAQAISIKTISYNKGNISETELREFNDMIHSYFKDVHDASYINFTQVNEYSRLYRIEGSEPTLNPYMLCAHLDVVPEGERDAWSDDPWRSTVKDGKVVFGRGAIDDKHSVLGILEALSYKVINGERPRRTFYIALGHDEEIGGPEGAAELKKEIEKSLDYHGEKLDFILDEGMFVMQDILPGIDDLMIYVGVAEKGSATLNLTVKGSQVHSSIPPRESTIGILSNAVAKLEEERQPSRFGSGPEVDTVNYAAPHATYGFQIVMGNLWMFSGLIAKLMGTVSEIDAVQRTTTAVTIFDAGFKVNVVPATATAVVNHRIHPIDDITSVLDHDRDTIDDERVEITTGEYIPPTKVSPYDNNDKAFQIIVTSAMEVYPNSFPVPGTMVANTDTMNYLDLCDKIYRFSPVRLTYQDLSRFHGIDEQISVDEYDRVVQTYYRIMTNADYDIQSPIML